MLANKLVLSPDQANQINPIIVDRQKQIKLLLADPTTGVLASRRRAQEIFRKNDAEISAILTPDQRTQYAAIAQQMLAQLRAQV